jgi:hypothetical protein
MEEKRKTIEGQEGDPAAQRKTQAALFSDEVKVGFRTY